MVKFKSPLNGVALQLVRFLLPARQLSDRSHSVGFCILGRQGALANAADRVNPQQITSCTVQFLNSSGLAAIDKSGD